MLWSVIVLYLARCLSQPASHAHPRARRPKVESEGRSLAAPQTPRAFQSSPSKSPSSRTGTRSCRDHGQVRLLDAQIVVYMLCCDRHGMSAAQCVEMTRLLKAVDESLGGLHGDGIERWIDVICDAL